MSGIQKKHESFAKWSHAMGGIAPSGGIYENARGRGVVASIRSSPGTCPCDRPFGLVLCHVCGDTKWGRIRYACPKHPQTIFLNDITQCINCRSHSFMLSEY